MSDRRRRKRERGAALTEFALVAPVLVLVAVGIAEFGLAWRDSMTVSTALRSGARVAANEGSDRLADHQALLALDAGLAELPGTSIERVVVFNAGTDAEPAQACKDGTPSAATGRQCNVYDAGDLDRPAADFAGTTTCAVTAPDRYWCPLDRDDDQSGTLDTLGVWVRIRHDWITGLFPGGGLTMEDTTVMRLEPGT
ncbi:MAG: TadE/TadG family type IV pilus assembly protein [Actinomycetota bacterium]